MPGRLRLVAALPAFYRPYLDRYGYEDARGDTVLCWDHARFVNHSCDASCLAAGNGFEIAVKDIHPGEQLTDDYAGLFSNNDALAGELLQAAGTEGEGLWRMPLPAAYEKQIESMIADMKNVGGRPAGSITAALFIQKFVAGLPWAHLDIASTAWKKPSTVPTIPDGATGYGVRLLNRLVADRYES